MSHGPDRVAPVLAICGHSGAGKTTLIERLVPALRALGWRIAVLKRTHHRVVIDVPGKDSDRFFRAGASVCFQAGGEVFQRAAAATDAATWRDVLRRLASAHDFVLVEGHKETPLPKVWLLAPGEGAPPPGIAHILATLGRADDRLALVLEACRSRATAALAARPLFGAVLVDRDADRAAALDALARLAPFVAQTVVVDDQPWPATITLPPARLVARAALASTLAAMRWAPDAAWLVVRPSRGVTAEALAELLARRGPGRWVLTARAGVDATLLEPQARAALEDAACDASAPGEGAAAVGGAIAG